MSDKPKPVSQEGQVASLTQHRAQITGQFEPTIYDTPYRKGERISCDDPSVAYMVRIGKVRVRKEMQTRGGRNLVTVDFLDKDAPLLVSRFITGAMDDRELQYFADTDVVIGEFPAASIGRLLNRPQFLASYARVASGHVYSLRRALFSQLERNQQKLEELEETKRQNEMAQRKIEELANANLDLQMDQSDLKTAQDEAKRLQTENEELKKALAASTRKIETLRQANLDLRASQEAMRSAHDEESERIVRLSKERYTELRQLRKADKDREGRRWKALEHLLERLGNPPLLPSEMQALVGDSLEAEVEDLPIAEVPDMTGQDIDSALSFCRAGQPSAAELEFEEIELDDSELIGLDAPTDDEGPRSTLVPPQNINPEPRVLAAIQPPTSCPQVGDLPRARAPMPTIDLDATLDRHLERAGITQTLQRIPTSVPKHQVPRPQTNDADQSRWSWPDDEPLFPFEQKGRAAGKPTAPPSDPGTSSRSTAETSSVRYPDDPPPVKKR